MPTYQELQTKVLRRVIDATPSVTAEVGQLVNQAIRELQTKHNYKVMEALLTANTNVDGDPNSFLVNRPSDWKEADGRAYLRQRYANARPLQWVASRKHAEMMFGTDQELFEGEPCAIFEGEPSTTAYASAFYVYPFPDANSDWDDGEYRIYVPYWKYLPALSAGSATNWFTDNADEFIVNRATGEAFLLNEDEERGTIWLQRAETKRAEVEKRDKTQRLAGIDHFVPKTGANS